MRRSKQQVTSYGRPIEGDLVAYNVGASPHSLGLILEATQQRSVTSSASQPSVLVQWVTMDGPTPRQCRIRPESLSAQQSDEPGLSQYGLHVGDRLWYWTETSGGYSTFKVVQRA